MSSLLRSGLCRLMAASAVVQAIRWRGEVPCPRPCRPGLGGWEVRAKSPLDTDSQKLCWPRAGFQGAGSYVRFLSVFLAAVGAGMV